MDCFIQREDDPLSDTKQHEKTCLAILRLVTLNAETRRRKAGKHIQGIFLIGMTSTLEPDHGVELQACRGAVQRSRRRNSKRAQRTGGPLRHNPSH